MATLSLSISSFPRRTSLRRQISSQLLKPTSPNQFLIKHTIATTFRKHDQFKIVKATKEEDPPLPEPPKDELTELGAEINKAMKERDSKGDFWGGVVEEIGEIEWPPFGKVLRTTGVVMGVIAGSSVVLLTVNAVLAELSDKVFAGRGVQDFFG